jgi:hypothetical protein
MKLDDALNKHERECLNGEYTRNPLPKRQYRARSR